MRFTLKEGETDALFNGGLRKNRPKIKACSLLFSLRADLLQTIINCFCH